MAHEIKAWIELTTGNYHGVVAATRAGVEGRSAPQAWPSSSQRRKQRLARIGDRRQAEVALDKGRRLLEAMPYPDNLDHHFGR